MAKQEKKFSGEIGIHYPLHVLNRYSLPELIGLAETAWRTMGQIRIQPGLDQRQSGISQRLGEFRSDCRAIASEARHRRNRALFS